MKRLLGMGLMILASACSEDAKDAQGSPAQRPSEDAGGGAPEARSEDAGGGAPEARSDVLATDIEAGVDSVPAVLPIAEGRHARLFNVVYSKTGDLYAIGQVGDATNPDDMATLLVKILPTGALDPNFGAGGIAAVNVVTGSAGESPRGLAVQASGKIVVAGTAEHGSETESTRDIVVLRFEPNGSLDPTFGTEGIVRLVLAEGQLVQQWGLALFENDDLVITGARKASGDAGTNELVVVRLSGGDGKVDSSFGPNGDGIFSYALATNVSPKTVSVFPDESLLVSGYTNASGNKPVLVKLTNAGLLDTTFATNGVFFPESGVPGFEPNATVEVYMAAWQGDKLVTTGYGKGDPKQAANGWISLRLTSSGAVDESYGTNGHVSLPINDQNAASRALTVLADGRVLLLGGASPPKPEADAGTQSQHAAFVMLTKDGEIDPSFSPSGPRLFDLGGPATGRAAHFFWAGAASPDGKNVAIVGVKGSVTANADAGIVGGTDEAIFYNLPVSQ